MHDMVEGFNVNCVNSNSYPILTYRDHQVADTDRPLVCTLYKMTRRDSLRAYFVIDGPFTSPRFEERSLLNRLGASENWLFIEDECSMDNLVVLDVQYCFAHLVPRCGEFSHQARRWERF